MKTKWKILIGLVGVLLVIVLMNPWQNLLQLYLKMTGQYQAPQYETSESIQARVNNANLYYDRLYKLSGPESFFDFQNEGLLSVPFIRIYNAKKQNLSSASGEKCKWTMMSVFSRDSLSMAPNEEVDYDYILQRLDTIDVRTDQDTFDFYVLAGWANYLPVLSDSLFFSTNRIKQNLNNRVCISYLNLDFQKGWESVFDQ
jgi:hypothetical protein